MLNEQWLKDFKEAAAAYTEKACKTKNSARKALVDSGIYDEEGNLTEHYR